MAKRNLSGLSMADLQAEIERRQRELPALRERRNRLLSELGDVEKEIAMLGGGGRGAGRGRGRGRGRVVAVKGTRPRNKVPLGDMIVQILPKDQPMKVSDIVDQVVARGYKTNSANFATIVNQTLIKDDRFKQHSRGHYVLA